MELTPSQLSSLNEMGIPVWALRTEDTKQQNIDINEQLLQCNCLVLVESQNDSQHIKRLLQAMLFSIGLQADQYAIITSDRLPQIQISPTQQTVLLVLGESFAQSLWGKSVIRGQIHHTLDVSVSTVVSMGLDELLVSPENKALVWQDLQLAKQIFDAS